MRDPGEMIDQEKDPDVEDKRFILKITAMICLTAIFCVALMAHCAAGPPRVFP